MFPVPVAFPLAIAGAVGAHGQLTCRDAYSAYFAAVPYKQGCARSVCPAYVSGLEALSANIAVAVYPCEAVEEPRAHPHFLAVSAIWSTYTYDVVLLAVPVTLFDTFVVVAASTCGSSTRLQVGWGERT